MKHSWVFALILGGVVGAFAVIVAVDDADGPPPPRPPAQVAVASREPQVEPFPGTITLDPSLDDAALARELERAHFERDWARAAAVGAVLRERRPTPGEDAEVEETPSAPSLVRMDHEYRRATFERELALRQNPATRAVREASPGDGEEAERRLVALLQAPPLRPEDAQVRADAAHLLARLRTDRAREALRAALEGPDADTSALAATALARADDPAATAILLELLESDRDPTLRARVADALVDSRALLDPAGPVVPALARVATSGLDVGVRTHAVATLARADLAEQPAGRAALVRLITTDTEEALVRQAAVAAVRAHHAVARALPPDVLDALLVTLDRSAGELRLEVIAALGEAAPAEALPRLDASALAATDAREARALHEAAAAVRARSPE